jgi:hypothetical protein
MAQPIPPKFRDFYAERYGAWVNNMDRLDVVLPRLVETQADYLDLLAAKVFGESLEDEN